MISRTAKTSRNLRGPDKIVWTLTVIALIGYNMLAIGDFTTIGLEENCIINLSDTLSLLLMTMILQYTV